jgi:hypothetical protein
VRGELRVKGFENRMLRKIFGPKRDAFIGGWTLLHNGALHNLYSSNIIRIIKLEGMRWAGRIACTNEERSTSSVLVIISERKKLLGRPYQRRDNNMNMNFRRIVLG